MVVVESCRHMVVEGICNVSLEKESSMVVVENCKHTVVEETCSVP